MRRGDFESLVRRHLDVDLLPRGFRLTPQPPADADDEKPSAVYEADPADFAKRYPRLAPEPSTTIPCIDFWIHLDPSTGKLTSELEGPAVETVMALLGVADPADKAPSVLDVDSQLTLLARRIVAILEAAAQ